MLVRAVAVRAEQLVVVSTKPDPALYACRGCNQWRTEVTGGYGPATFRNNTFCMSCTRVRCLNCLSPLAEHDDEKLTCLFAPGRFRPGGVVSTAHLVDAAHPVPERHTDHNWGTPVITQHGWRTYCIDCGTKWLLAAQYSRNWASLYSIVGSGGPPQRSLCPPCAP